MEIKELIVKKIDRVPPSYLKEILNFIKFLENKTVESKSETAILSESSLQKDWLKAEEEEAWKGL